MRAMANSQLSSNLLPQSKLAIRNQNTLKTLRWMRLDRLKSQGLRSRRTSHSYSPRYHPTNSHFLLQVCPPNVDSCGAWSGYCWERELFVWMIAKIVPEATDLPPPYYCE